MIAKIVQNILLNLTVTGNFETTGFDPLLILLAMYVKSILRKDFFFPFLSSKSFFPVVAFLPVSSSLPSPQQHFRTRVILSQQHLMYI